MLRRFLMFPMLLFFLLIYSITIAQDRPMMVNVKLTTPDVITSLHDNNFDITYIEANQFAQVITDHQNYNWLIKNGFNVEIVHDDLIAFYQSRYPLGTTMGGFKTFTEAETFMDQLHTNYPSITTAKSSIGTSILGRSLWMMKISDNPGTDEEEPEIIINSLIHSCEPMGLEVSLRFMEYLCSNYQTDPAITYLVNNREFYFVPIVNPDGYVFVEQNFTNGGVSWRKNRRDNGNGTIGVNLNRNWGYNWGLNNVGSSPDPNSPDYRGTAAFSEPETQALRQFIDQRSAKIVANLHSYGNLFIYPWGYATSYTKDDGLFRVFGQGVHSLNGYAYGICINTAHYYANGESCDWQYGETTEKPKILGFVLELCDNTEQDWPPLGSFDSIWLEGRAALLYLSEHADNPYIGTCNYVPGDVNGSGSANGLDVTYLLTYLKGGTPPPQTCTCGSYGVIYNASDANGDCQTNGLDVTHLVNYLKGGNPPTYCGYCPPLVNPN
jgi:hypothetical protein